MFFIFLNMLFLTNSIYSHAQIRVNTDLTSSTLVYAEFTQLPSNTLNPNHSMTITYSNPNQNTNICTREETYVERVEMPTMEPVRIRTSHWCLEFPPRCTSYKTTMREKINIKNITKTRTIRFCCNGYESSISENGTICKPVCHGGCGRGHCQKPDICSCEPGYEGKHCTQRCDSDHWGLECKNKCQCQNDAVCDNKKGICHCIAGWMGQLCEKPCPAGTYGIMCRKQCTCATHQTCQPQSGACVTLDHTELLPNVTQVMIETLNSTIVNLTNNLDRIAKNIGQITSTSTETFLDVANSMPEVIFIKQDDTVHHIQPKIILHQPGTDLLENLHTTAGVGVKSPEIIHVITTWPTNVTPTHENTLNLANFGNGGGSFEATPINGFEQSEHTKTTAEHDANLYTTLLIILLIIMIVIVVSCFYVYRRYHWQEERVQAALAARTNGSLSSNTIQFTGNQMNGSEFALNDDTLNKNCIKPLPDLPAFVQTMCNKIDGPELYDSPSNNSSIKTPPYAYARKDSLYSVITSKSRKGSFDSQLYDEIPYPNHHQHQHEYQQKYYNLKENQPQLQPQPQPKSQPRYHHATTAVAYMSASSVTAHHVSHFVIPPQNSKYLQVPQLIVPKVAHF